MLTVVLTEGAVMRVHAAHEVTHTEKDKINGVILQWLILQGRELALASCLLVSINTG